MTTISAKSILASQHAQRSDVRLDTLLLRYPKVIHAEFMTHRMFSRNAASSRAIPIEKLIQSVIDDPFIPLHWGKNQPGMQAGEEHSNQVHNWHEYDTPLAIRDQFLTNEDAWLQAVDQAVRATEAFSEAGYHKQIVNRLLEPFSHITVVVSSTNWSNFLPLRDHPDAEPHMRLLAQEVRKALDGAEVQTLQPGEWHLPFVTAEDWETAWQCAGRLNEGGVRMTTPEQIQLLIKLSVARCASTSYKTVDGFDMTLERAIELHDKLVGSRPLHASPAEHACQADDWWKDAGVWGYPGQHGNFVGFRQYRKMLPNECL
jgi:hypothetical protein